MLIKDIQGFLEDLESSIFLGFIPDEPANVCVINATGGYAPARIVDGTKTVEQPTFQVIIRDGDYTSGDARIQAVVDLLDGYSDETYIHIFRQSEVIPLGKDEKERSRFSVNFYARYERSV